MNAPSHIPRRRQASVAMSFVVGRRNYEIDVDVWRRSRSGACAAARASGSVRRVCAGRRSRGAPVRAPRAFGDLLAAYQPGRATLPPDAALRAAHTHTL